MAADAATAARATPLEGSAPLLARRSARSWRDAFVRLAQTLFGPAAARSAERNVSLAHSLMQAHVPLLPESYVAATWLASALAGAAMLVVLGTVALGPALLAGEALSLPLVVVALATPIIVAAGLYVGLMVYPDYRAGERRRAIDSDLPYAVNYVAAMSSAGVVPAAIFRDLARQPVYGEASRELAWMARDMELFGHDFIQAMNRAIARSPSRRFQEFLQGAKTTVLSGGDLKSYFSDKAEQYMKENRRRQKEYVDGLGILAESYVTVVIAGPLFMLVLLSIMAVIGRAAETAEMALYGLVFLMLPVSHIAFTWVVRNMSAEG